MLSQDAGILKVKPWAFGCDVHSAAGVARPAVETLVPLIVRVLIVSVLHCVVALSVEPVLRLNELGKTAGNNVVVGNVCKHVSGQSEE